MNKSLLPALLLSGMPLLATPSAIDLTGTWQLKLDAKDKMIKSPASSWTFNDTMKLPGTTDLAKKGPHVTAPQPYEYHLNREWNFKGPAYYTREITIPSDWKNIATQLVLERVMWQSRVWIDGEEISHPKDSLNTPHVHNLGKLTPGKHQLVLRIDNRMIHPIGDKGHAYGQQTQSTWNGVVGKLELCPVPDNHISLIRVFPENDGTVNIEVNGQLEGQLSASISENTASQKISGTQASLTLKLKNPTLWSEFSPKTYNLIVQLADKSGQIIDSQTTTFGFREVANQGNQLLINGKPAFMRGNLECAVFPKLGHPPVTVTAWKKSGRSIKITT